MEASDELSPVAEAVSAEASVDALSLDEPVEADEPHPAKRDTAMTPVSAKLNNFVFLIIFFPPAFLFLLQFDTRGLQLKKGKQKRHRRFLISSALAVVMYDTHPRDLLQCKI